MTAPAATYREIFRIPVFRTLFGATSCGLLGETVRMLALAMLLYQSTESPIVAVLAYVSGFLPYAAGGFLLALADRLPARTVMVGWAVVRTAVTALLAVDVLPWPVAVALVFAAGLGAPIGSAAANAYLPEVVPPPLYVLGRSLFGVVAGGAQVGGFAVGGVLIVATGPTGALWLTTAMFGLAAALMWLRLPRVPARSLATSSVLADTWAVNATLLSTAPVRRLLLAFWVPVAFVVGADSLAVPYAAESGQPDAASLLFAAFGAGLIVGGALLGRAPVALRDRLVRPLPVIASLMVLGYAFKPAVPLAAVLIAVAGAGMSYELGLQERFLAAIPPEHTGQAFGLLGVGVMVGQALGALGAGLVAQWLGPAPAMALCGGAALVAALLLVPGPRR